LNGGKGSEFAGNKMLGGRTAESHHNIRARKVRFAGEAKRLRQKEGEIGGLFGEGRSRSNWKRKKKEKDATNAGGFGGDLADLRGLIWGRKGKPMNEPCEAGKKYREKKNFEDSTED